jgi:hypothetical protein
MSGLGGRSLSSAQLLPLVHTVAAWAPYVIPVLLVAYTIWWSYTLRQGSKINRWTLALHIGVYGVAAAYIYTISWFEFYWAGDRVQVVGVLWMLSALAIAYTAVRLGIWYGARNLQVIQSEGGHWHLRGPIEIAIFWGTLFAIRYALETFVLQGYSVLFPLDPLPAGVTVQDFATVVIVIASLYLLSFGFLLGVSIAEWILHSELASARPHLATPTKSSTSAGSPGGTAGTGPGGPSSSDALGGGP